VRFGSTRFGDTFPMRHGLLVVTLSLFLAGSAVAAAATAPTLRLVGAAGVQGRHFKPHVTVRVAFAGAHVPKRLVRTTSAGTFVAALPTVQDRCVTLTVIATAGGQTATLKVPRLPACLPPGADGPPDVNGGIPANADGVATVNGG